MNTNVNKKHKSSVFSALFSNPHALRELYSAIEGVDISSDAVIEINTLSDVLYMEQLNDISFTIDDRIVVLWISFPKGQYAVNILSARERHYQSVKTESDA